MTIPSSDIDLINKKTMRSAVAHYSVGDQLSPAEEAALSKVADEVRNKRILDIGVGGGRTVAPLLKVSQNYIGVDYVPEMVEQCQRRFPNVKIEVADARSMPQFQDQSFDLILFMCQGICMVNHEDRISILKEVHRLLCTGGIFIFSTFNQDSPEHAGIFELPQFVPSKNPLRFLVRTARFLSELATRIINRMRYKGNEIRGKEYSLINDRCHHYATMLYYISLPNQLKQLQAVGFTAPPNIYDIHGNEVASATPFDCMTFVVRK